ncbi:MAG TPA: homoserine O-succinyltransferase [Candidatus Acidoferrum sp.]|jgi:homoserine O-succinyltransferase
MPLFVDGGLNPVRWAGDKFPRLTSAGIGSAEVKDWLRVALVNNMPDPALEDTESQFFELLDAASGRLPLHIQLFSLPNISRSERAQQHLDNFYASTTTLFNQRFDGVIITGTEPRQPDLRNEPYWGTLTDLFNWAEENSLSTVLSCLAAHAGVLNSDGICRNPLGEKRFGVFEHSNVADHPMTRGIAEPIRIPHSRWNEVREQDLIAAGYTVLTKSARAGVDLFVKEKKKSLFVHFQGHPEYITQTLHKEYRRDVKRYLRQERETYPLVPEGYYDAKAVALLAGFRGNAEAHRFETIMENFPEADVVDTLQHSWLSSATHIYRNWLSILASRRASATEISVMVRVG